MFLPAIFLNIPHPRLLYGTASQGRGKITVCKSIYHKVVSALYGGGSGRMNRVQRLSITISARTQSLGFLFNQCGCSPENHRDIFLQQSLKSNPIGYVSGFADVTYSPENYRDILCWKRSQEQPNQLWIRVVLLMNTATRN
jgi:hypothetical protein